ncbi:MAG: ATP-dependent DNA helicase RecQ [Ignavibacteriaceae bacterium]|nr:ATP-dependent DNA helicase RecQ [Ignavibacteriaceae bacterium]
MQSPSEILKTYFGYDSFRGKQEEIIRRLTEQKQNALVLMPTGGGKSICYQIPALMFEGGTIVISPLIALMQDQVDALRKRNIRAAFINSTVSASDREKRLAQFVRGDLKLLYVTPERFRKAEFTQEIKKADISLLAVDEAHCISEWGHDFRPDYSRIAEFRELLGNPLTIALTATATPDVKTDIIKKLGLSSDLVRIYEEGIERPNLRLEALDVFDEKETFREIKRVLTDYQGSGIIYFALIKKLEEFSEKLRAAGFPHSVYHGKLEPHQRKRVQREFLSGSQKVILATNAFGMGIDKPDIRFVIHAEVPSSLESYYQEIGRAGRDGLPSLCLLLYNSEDLYTQMQFVQWANPDAEFYHRMYELILAKPGEVNSLGYEFVMEQMSHKNRFDFRVDTVLGMFDRYGVTAGSLEERNLEVVSELPPELDDEEYLKEKLLRDNKKLLAVVNYFKQGKCRRTSVSEYFGFGTKKNCGNCDICTEIAEKDGTPWRHDN